MQIIVNNQLGGIMLIKTQLYILNISVLLATFAITKSTIFAEDIHWVNNVVIALTIISSGLYVYTCIKNLSKD